MSVRAMAWALDARRTGPLSPDARLVLVALADYADPDGLGAFPSKARLAERLGISERAVKRDLSTLRALGVIRYGDAQLVSHYRADRRPSVYDLAMLLDQTATMLEQSWRGDESVPPLERGDAGDRNGGTDVVERGDAGVPQSKNVTNNQNPTPLPPSADAAATLNIEHAQAEALRCRRCGGLNLPEHACRQAVPPPEYFRAMVEQARDG